jgi:ribosomal protein S13
MNIDDLIKAEKKKKKKTTAKPKRGQRTKTNKRTRR